MKATNLDLLATFEQCLSGLTLWSETESPYQILVWEVSEKGGFSIEALLLSLEYLSVLDKQNLFADIKERFAHIEQNEDIQFNRKNCFIYSPEQDRSSEEGVFNREAFMRSGLEAEAFRSTILERLTGIRQKYQELVASLKDSFEDLQIYRLTSDDLDFQRFYDVLILVGKTKDNQWMGLSTKINYRNFDDLDLPASMVRSGQQLRSEQVETPSPSVQSVINIVEQVTQNFTFLPIAPSYFDFEITEPDYPFAGFVWEVAGARSQVVEQLLESINFMQVKPLQNDTDFYNLLYVYPDENGEYEIDENFQKATMLLETLKSQLRTRKAYRFGLCEIDLYFVGATPENDWVCISSVVVET